MSSSFSSTSSSSSSYSGCHPFHASDNDGIGGVLSRHWRGFTWWFQAGEEERRGEDVSTSKCKWNYKHKYKYNHKYKYKHKYRYLVILGKLKGVSVTTKKIQMQKQIYTQIQIQIQRQGRKKGRHQVVIPTSRQNGALTSIFSFVIFWTKYSLQIWLKNSAGHIANIFFIFITKDFYISVSCLGEIRQVCH